MNRFSWLGGGLLIIGSAMLLDRLDVVRFGWQPVFWTLVALFGIVKAVDGFGKKRSGRVFWGTFLFLFGVYELLRDLDVIELRSYWMFPAILLIIGLSLLMMYINSPREWHLLIPSLLLLGTGAAIILTEFGYFYRYDVIEAVRMYWPVGLILFGFALVARRFSPHSKV
jgi:hypothetical protein